MPKPTPTPVAFPRPKVTHPQRSEPNKVSKHKANAVFKLDKKMRPKQYVPITSNRFKKIKNGQVIKDNATGLMWQQAGTSNRIGYSQALQFIKRLNRDNFAGYSDWRLPTVYELTSLLTTTKQNVDLYIHQIFDKKQRWCWSSDMRASGGVWDVYFYNGKVDWSEHYHYDFVRAVRAGQFKDKSGHKIKPRSKPSAVPTSVPTPIASSHQKATLPRRSEPITVSKNEANTVFKLDENWFPKQYVPMTWFRFKKIKNGQVIKDNATDFMWQQSGTFKYINYSQAQGYIKRLNRDNFAGYNDWRLPTVDELTSLLTKTKQKGDLRIHPIFDKYQRWCWSFDRRMPAGAWSVDFLDGWVSWDDLAHLYCVRAVRAGQYVPIKERKKSVEMLKPQPGPITSSRVKVTHSRRSEPKTVSGD